MNTDRSPAIIVLTWVDSLEKPGWLPLHEAARPDPCTVCTVGFLISEPTEDDPNYVVVRDIAPDQDLACGLMRIPEVAVLSVRLVGGYSEPVDSDEAQIQDDE